ncbi:MAG: diaminopimelate decarboxylase [Chloroflexi bacterium]|uniref:Diaminopimelate decarboxylase n=1 Tax=Candidatus Chlorohelix allophototropha TaxID=3003348 RepID=A0A8T7M0V7_9CHLR|nr:diaminopimelate decarboxylase [Chloroflexota bacterium]WJW67462.1 diaminopimelate decarboxylase [Chloroflexota bacterium L227-S17]
MPINLPNKFEYRDNHLFIDNIELGEIANKVGTPCYVYSASAICERYRQYTRAFLIAGLEAEIFYAVKACSNLEIIRLLANEGAGADVVSGGELLRAMKAGVPAHKIVFAGVGKTAKEIELGLKSGIRAFNVESEPELRLIERLAKQLSLHARISLRLNPGVDPHTHAYITTGQRGNKFGISYEQALELARYATNSPYLWLVGVQCHIGSQLHELEPISEAANRLAELAQTVERQNNCALEYLDIGGGLGVAYRLAEEQAASPEALAQLVATTLARYGRNWKILAEPGRWLVAEAGTLLTEVLFLKSDTETTFAIVDAAMNDLIRPSLYQAYHEIVPLVEPLNSDLINYDVVGPVCESGDFLAQNRALPLLEEGMKLAILSAGAYGFSMSSNYNSRPRAAEILVEGDNWRSIRARETFEDLIRAEG